MASRKSGELRWLRLQQVDQLLEPWIQVARQPRPRKGWISTIRQALGMGLSQLAERLGMNPSALQRLEKREVRGKITMESLSRVAEAMDCRLVYAIVPNTSLADRVERRMHGVARERVARVSHTMDLEAQGIGEQEQSRQEARVMQRLTSEWPRNLWDGVPNDV